MFVYEDEALASHAHAHKADASGRGEFMGELTKLQRLLHGLLPRP